MKLILGLGFSDIENCLIRHNIGYQVFDWFCQKYEIEFKPNPKDLFTLNSIKIFSEDVCLLKIRIKSHKVGDIVSEVLKVLKIQPKDLIVIQDDKDMKFGQIKLSRSGSSITHTAMNSIVEALHTSDFSKVRIGVGQRKTQNNRRALLSQFSEKEFNKLPQIYEAGVNLIEEIIQGKK